MKRMRIAIGKAPTSEIDPIEMIARYASHLASKTHAAVGEINPNTEVDG